MVKHIIISQIGARHRYLIPQILYKHDLLYSLFTDSCKYSNLGKIVLFLKKIGIKNKKLSKLIERDPKIPSELITSSDYLSLKLLLCKFSKPIVKYETTYQSLSPIFKRIDINGADCIFNMYFENIDFLKYAKSKGKIILVDIYENPMAFSALINEIKEKQEYASLKYLLPEYKAKNSFREKYIETILEIADYYTIPSTFVLNALKNYKNFKIEKAFLLPYPTSIKSKKYNYKAQKHTLIWVGNDPIRKGLVYCARAATILKKKYKDLDFRIIGAIDSRLINNYAFKDLNFIGTLSSKDLQKEYETAEAYVFPTLFEGFAGTVIEAASCGCPIITTEGAGTNMTEFPAIYIPRYDYKAIVEAVTKIFENQNFRDDLSKKTYEYSKQLSPDVYENNLIKIINKI